MDRGTNAEIADTLDTDVRRLVLATIAILAVLDRDLGEPNTNSANVAAQDVAAVEGLARPNCVIKTFKVDWGTPSATAIHTEVIKHILKPQFLCVRTRADSMGP